MNTSRAGGGALVATCLLLTVNPAKADPTYDYVIIATNRIVTNSTRLDDYVAHKTAQGYSVLVKTVESIEAEYTKAARPALFETTDERADRIKAFLKDTYAGYGIVYVLLIGNPDPDDYLSASDSVGDVPMKFCYPDEHSNKFYAPTDSFYTDLHGRWDKNGNGLFGEWSGDTGTGGVDFAHPDVFVSRIAYYSTDMTMLDSVFAKIIAYEAPGADESWKRKCFMPNPIDWSDYYGREGNLSPITMAEFIKDTMLVPEGFAYYRIYEHAFGYPPMSVTPPTEMVPSPLGYTCFTRYSSSHYFKAGANVTSEDAAAYTIGEMTDGSDSTSWSASNVAPNTFVQFKTVNADDAGGTFAPYKIVIRAAAPAQFPQRFKIEMASSGTFGDRFTVCTELDAAAHAVAAGAYYELRYEAPATLSTIGGRRYIRVTYTGAASQPSMQINEFLGYTQENKSIQPYVIPEWKHGYGVVYYNTHGSSTSASDIIDSYNTWQLDNTRPSFVFQKACSNATPEVSNNLCAQLVLEGAIASFGATRVSYGWGDMGYQVFLPKLINENKAFGRILGETRQTMANNNWYGWDAYYSDAMRFNLFGDPTMHLLTDRDGDVMPYWWEERYGLDPDAADGSGDPDRDTLTNAQEYANGTSPIDPDTDDDGVNDDADACPGTRPGTSVDAFGCALGDADHDGDVDLADFAAFQSCFNGPNRPIASGCLVDSDFDDDGDVDLSDFASFLTCFNGPNRPPACS